MGLLFKLQEPPDAPDRLLLFHDDARSRSQRLGEEFYRVERHMDYTQPNLLWGTLALSRPARQPDNTVVYSIALPKPVHLSREHGFPDSPLPDGHYTGRITLHLADARFAPIFNHLNGWASVERCPAEPGAPQGACEALLYLDQLKPIEILKPTHAMHEVIGIGAFVGEIGTAVLDGLRAAKRAAKTRLTALLHPDTRADTQAGVEPWQRQKNVPSFML